MRNKKYFIFVTIGFVLILFTTRYYATNPKEGVECSQVSTIEGCHKLNYCRPVITFKGKYVTCERITDSTILRQISNNKSLCEQTKGRWINKYCYCKADFVFVKGSGCIENKTVCENNNGKWRTSLLPPQKYCEIYGNKTDLGKLIGGQQVRDTLNRLIPDN